MSHVLPTYLSGKTIELLSRVNKQMDFPMTIDNMPEHLSITLLAVGLSYWIRVRTN